MDKPKEGHVPYVTCFNCDERATLSTIANSGVLGEPKSDTRLWGSDEEREEWERSHDTPYRAIICRKGRWHHIRVGDDRGRLVYLSTQHGERTKQ